MREIKFRGKRKDNGEWVVGYYAYKELSDEHFIIVPTFDPHSTAQHQYFTDYLVDPKTVSQYTGIKDDNGREIYEGDIVIAHYMLIETAKPYRAQVEWDKYRFSLRNLDDNNLNLQVGPFPRNNLDGFGMSFEIIGDIYDGKSHEPTKEA
jgi:uncharacterized phage protein (TIGR01671 family)